MNRREFVKLGAVALAGSLAPGSAQVEVIRRSNALDIDPTPLFELSPWLYMQFMEPLGVTDSSVEASWDHSRNDWRPDLVEVTKELVPGMLRWGGLFSAYYKWREGVGPREFRKPMHNLVWGGIESNQVGTVEFVDFCRRTKTDPLMCVNFEAEGDRNWARNAWGEIRSGDAQEAADWVDYCNNPSNKDRLAHGHKDPLTINVWQLGNETSYSRSRFNRDTAVQKTIEFSKAMRKVDPNIKLIGWAGRDWAEKMIERAGEHIDYLAFHHLFDPGKGDPKSPLRDGEYYKDPDATWAGLMKGVAMHEREILHIREQVAAHKFPLALTECHYTMPGRDRCDLNSVWATGVSYARFLNLHQRHGDLLRIANLADFCGTRWQTNAVMLPVPGGRAYMLPVAKVMMLYRKHSGRNFIRTTNGPEGLDITASCTGDKLFLHIVNTDRKRSARLDLSVRNHSITNCTTFTIAAPPEFEIWSAENDLMNVQEQAQSSPAALTLPAASVTAAELTIAS